MNLGVQIGIGLIPTIVILIALLIFGKKSRRLVAELLVLIVFISGSSIYIGTHFFDLWRIQKEVEHQVNMKDVSKAVMKMASAGDASSANEFMDRVMQDEGYTAEYTLNLAKICALKQDYKGALVLYRKVLASNETVSDSQDKIDDAIAELETVTHLEEVDEGLLKSGVMGAEFTTNDSNGKEIHVSAGEQMKLVSENKKKEEDTRQYFQNLVKDSVGNEADDKYVQATEIILDIEHLYQKELSGSENEFDNMQDTYEEHDTDGEQESNSAEVLMDKIESLFETYPELESLADIRYARLKLCLLLGDYNFLAKNINEYTDYKEYMVIANLYLNGYIDGDAFQEGYGDNLQKMYQEVAKQLKKVYKKQLNKDSDSTKQEIENYIEDIEHASENPIIGKINYQLLDYTNQEIKDNAKIYLLLAEIAQSNDNSGGADKYITKSIDSIGSCEDDSFTEPMRKLVKLITQDDSTDTVNVSDYVQAVLANQSVIDIDEKLLQKKGTYTEEKEDGDDAETEEKGNEAFDTFLTDYVSEKSISLNIMNVDVSKFETVKTSFTVNDEIGYTSEDIKKTLKVYDCGIEISDFNVEKVEFDVFYTLLCCDTSGSMAGQAIEDLKSAVSLFVSKKEEKGDIALMEFNDQPSKSLPFGSSTDNLQKEAEQITANGGTNMYDAAIAAIAQFPEKSNSLKCIILMSDGQDNNPHSQEEIALNIGAKAKEKNVVIYTIGLGQEVDSDYLGMIAKSTGGSYVYVNDSQSLYKFYALLNNQNKNQYQVTYKAADTLTETDRECRLELEADTLSYDTKYYNLSDNDQGGTSLIGKSISGLASRLMYKNDNSAQKNMLYGSGFSKEDSVRVVLCGDREYDLNAVYGSESEYNLTIPANIPCGIYDVRVQIDGRMRILKEELTIVKEGDVKTTTFGEYTFTSFQKEEYLKTIVLSGYVQMNGWLNFHGTITLTGDLSGKSIVMNDKQGGYVQFDKEKSYWLGRYLANKNINMPIVPFEEIALYNEKAEGSSDPYVKAVNVATNYYVKNVIEMEQPSVALYPDRIELDIKKFVTKLNEQYQLFNANEKKVDEIFTFEHEEKAVISGKNIGLNIDLNWADAEEDNYHTLQIGNMPFHFNHKKIHFVLNSVDSEDGCATIFFEYQTKIAFLDMDSAGFDIKLKCNNDSIKLSDVGFYVDKKVNFTVSGIPCSLKDFKLKLSDMDKGGPTKWVWTGSTDVSAGDVASVFPGLEDWIGNLTIVEMNDTTIEGRLSDFYLYFDTSFKLLEKMEIGNLKLKLGNISYTNMLLGMKDENVKGYVGEFNGELKNNNEHFIMKVSGQSQVSVTDRFVGVHTSGGFEAKIILWNSKLIKKEISGKVDGNGELSVGMYKDSADRLNFGIWSRGKNVEGKEFNVFIYWNKAEGLEHKLL